MGQKTDVTIELWLLVSGLAVTSLSGLLRMLFVLRGWDFLLTSGAQPGPPYQLLMGLAWAAGGTVCAGGLLWRARWAPNATRLTVLALAAWDWVDRLALARSADAVNNWPYALAVTLISVTYTMAVLALKRQKRFFQK